MAQHPFDAANFLVDAIAPETQSLNERLRAAPAPKPGELSAPRSARARTLRIPARGGHKIELHIVAPDRPRGVYMHLHGGGLVMGSASDQDDMLDNIADSTGLACVSVEYRLAPEFPYPAAWDDCEDAARWLIANARGEFGCDLVAVGGESAGALLTLPTIIRLRDRHGIARLPAMNLCFGVYDSSMTPSQTLIGSDGITLGVEDIHRCVAAYAPDPGSRRDPDLSALYADLHGLPPSLLTVGTLDPFLDDSLFLYARLIAAGNETELAIYPGGVHGFTLFDIPLAAQAHRRVQSFLSNAADLSR